MNLLNKYLSNDITKLILFKTYEPTNINDIKFHIYWSELIHPIKVVLSEMIIYFQKKYSSIRNDKITKYIFKMSINIKDIIYASENISFLIFEKDETWIRGYKYNNNLWVINRGKFGFYNEKKKHQKIFKDDVSKVFQFIDKWKILIDKYNNIIQSNYILKEKYKSVSNIKNILIYIKEIDITSKKINKIHEKIIKYLSYD